MTIREARALAGGFGTVVLHARPDAVALYERNDFERRGTRVVLDLEHHVMERRIG